MQEPSKDDPQAIMPAERNAAPSSSEGERELIAAKKMAGEQFFGRVGHPIRRPLSEQLKQEMARQFPEDGPLYLKADMAQRRIMGLYALMRMLTYALTFLPLMFVALAVSGAWPKSLDLPWLGGAANRLHDGAAAFGLLGPAACIVLAAIPLWLVRVVIRAWVIDRIRRRVEVFSNTFARPFDEILSEVNKRCTQALHRDENEANWPKRARDAIRVALWQGKRAEYLNRYTTTVLWKINVYIQTAEWVSWIAKGAAFLLVAVTMFQARGLLNAFAPVAVLGAASMAGWVLWPRFKNDLWTEAFLEESKFESRRTHYFNSVAEVVETLVRSVMANEPGSNRKSG